MMTGTSIIRPSEAISNICIPTHYWETSALVGVGSTYAYTSAPTTVSGVAYTFDVRTTSASTATSEPIQSSYEAECPGSY